MIEIPCFFLPLANYKLYCPGNNHFFVQAAYNKLYFLSFILPVLVVYNVTILQEIVTVQLNKFRPLLKGCVLHTAGSFLRYVDPLTYYLREYAMISLTDGFKILSYAQMNIHLNFSRIFFRFFITPIECSYSFSILKGFISNNIERKNWEHLIQVGSGSG